MAFQKGFLRDFLDYQIRQIIRLSDYKINVVTNIMNLTNLTNLMNLMNFF
jgi:hypothetical protein